MDTVQQSSSSSSSSSSSLLSLLSGTTASSTSSEPPPPSSSSPSDAPLPSLGALLQPLDPRAFQAFMHKMTSQMVPISVGQYSTASNTTASYKNADSAVSAVKKEEPAVRKVSAESVSVGASAAPPSFPALVPLSHPISIQYLEPGTVLVPINYANNTVIMDKPMIVSPTTQVTNGSAPPASPSISPSSTATARLQTFRRSSVMHTDIPSRTEHQNELLNVPDHQSSGMDSTTSVGDPVSPSLLHHMSLTSPAQSDSDHEEPSPMMKQGASDLQRRHSTSTHSRHNHSHSNRTRRHTHSHTHSRNSHRATKHHLDRADHQQAVPKKRDHGHLSTSSYSDTDDDDNNTDSDSSHSDHSTSSSGSGSGGSTSGGSNHSTPTSRSNGSNSSGSLSSSSSSSSTRHRFTSKKRRCVLSGMKLSSEHEVEDCHLSVLHYDTHTIRVVRVQHRSSQSISYYVHGADVGGVIERKSNISRMFGQFTSPAEKVLMNVTGKHNHCVGQEANVLTIAGVQRLMTLKKCQNQPEYIDWLNQVLLPTLRGERDEEQEKETRRQENKIEGEAGDREMITTAMTTTTTNAGVGEQEKAGRGSTPTSPLELFAAVACV